MTKDYLLDTLKRDKKALHEPFIDEAKGKRLGNKRDLNPDSFVNDNLFTYDTLITTWLEMVSAFSTEAKEYLTAYIRRLGLAKVVQTCSQMCDDVIIPALDDGVPLDTIRTYNEFVMMLYWDIRGYCLANGQSTEDHNIGRYLLEILRFPKRFSPVHNLAGLCKTYQSVFDVEAEDRVWDEEFIPNYHNPLLQRVRYYTGIALKHYHDDHNDRYISNGVCADASTLLEKYALLSTFDGYTRTQGSFMCHDTLLERLALFVKHKGSVSHENPIVYDASCAYYARFNAWPTKLCLGKVVPKSYKTGRFIAEEETVRQYINSSKGEAIRRSVERAGLGQYMPFLDQTVNYDIARRASIDGSIATIDLSHASDSITATKLLACFPVSVALDILEDMPRWLVLPDRMRKLRMAFPSGSVLTPPVESVLFWGIAMAATEWYASYGDPNVAYHVPTAYNDDITCDARAAGAVCDCLQWLGFTVNKEKSFYNPNGRYRESCGGEFVNGMDVTSVYWPRRESYGPKMGHRDISSLVSLQRALMARKEYMPAGRVLRTMIRKNFPIVSSLSDPSLTPHALVDPYPFSGLSLVVPRAWRDVKEEDILSVMQAYPLLQRDRAGFPLVGSPTMEYTPVDQRIRYEGLHACKHPVYEFYEYISYLSFLKNGPHYESPLDRLLGVSTPRQSYEEVAAKPEVVWRRTPLIP